MRILLLSNSASEHTQKWARGLSEAGIEVGIFSLNRSSPEWYREHQHITVLHEPALNKGNAKLSTKAGYLKNVKSLKKSIAAFKPDVLHAHYATSYGMLGKLSKFHPFFISVWGSDVYDFPKKSAVHRLLLKSILSKADMISSTSHSMKRETHRYTAQPVAVIPFGIDPAYFETAPPARDTITIGLVKSLETKYGIDILIRAFDLVVKKYPGKSISLLLVGDGSKKEEYKELAHTLGIADKVTFTGKVPHEQVIKYHEQIDIFASLSVLDSESFGVSLVEAMAMAKPIVASDVSGFKEVLGEESCGITVPRNAVEPAAAAIARYIDDPQYGKMTGANARNRAMRLYNWKNNLEEMVQVYRELINKNKNGAH